MMINSLVSPFISSSEVLNASGRSNLPESAACAPQSYTVRRRSSRPEPAPRGRLLVRADGSRRGDEIGALEAHQLLETALALAGEPQRVRVQRLLEDRAREAGVAVALATLGAGEDPPELLGAGRIDPVLVLAREALRDRDEL